jgi:hypothetical protein
MNDLLWLVNHPLWGNVMGILTSQNPDTPKGLESQPSVRICKIPTEHPHQIEQELKNFVEPEWIPAELPRSSYSEDSWQAGKSYGPHYLAPLSTLQRLNLKAPWGELNLTFFTLSIGGGTVVFIGGVRGCSGWRLGAWGPLVRPASYATWPGGQVSSSHRLLALDTLSTTSAGHVDKMVFGNAPTHGWTAKVVWPASHTLARLSLCFVPHHFLMPYFLWLCLILNIMKICMDFGPYGAFPSSDVPEMVDQQNLWNSLVISTYLWYPEWNVGMLPVNICILWPPTEDLWDNFWGSKLILMLWDTRAQPY